MVVFSIITFFVAVLFGAVAVSIYRGNIKLIHDYHYKKVTDQKGYTKAFGKALAPISIGSFLSGVTSLFGKADERCQWQMKRGGLWRSRPSVVNGCATNDG